MERSERGQSSSHLGQTIGAALGGIAVGLIAGALGIFGFRRCCGGRSRSEVREDFIRDSHHSSGHTPPREVRSISGTGLEYIVEPFSMPASATSSSDPTAPLLPGGTPTSPPASPPDATATSTDPAVRSGSGRRPNVYVVHHDGGRAPVTVYTDAGAEVVELPPRYADSGSATSEGQGQSRRERKGRGPRPV